jgi:hypothetical protein
LARAESGLRIVPVILRPCNWQRVRWLSGLQVRPKDGRALSLGRKAKIETDCTAIVNEIAAILEELVIESPRFFMETETVAVEETLGTKTDILSCGSTQIGRDAAQADMAVREVTEIASVPDVTQVLRSFRSELKIASDAIVAVATYKELHDELHTFEAEPFADILNAHRRVDSDNGARERLSLRAESLLGTTHLSRALAQRLLASEREIAWIERLDQAHRLWVDAVATQDVGRAATSVMLITRVLDVELPRLNEAMVNQAGTLEFVVGPVTRAFEFVHEHSSALHINPERDGDIFNGIGALGRLRREFMTMVAEHNLWQSIEEELRIIETSVASGFEQLEFLWPELKKKIESIFQDHYYESRATNLRMEAHHLQDALNLPGWQKALRVRDLFDRFRRSCGRHFFFVDSRQREECGRLSGIGESLELLLRMINTGTP